MNYSLRVIPILTRYFDIVFDICRIYSDILNSIWHFSGIYSDIQSGILSGVYSDMLSGNYSDISSNILSEIMSGILFDICSDILSGSLSGIYSDILSGILFGILSSILSCVFGSRATPQPPELAMWHRVQGILEPPKSQCPL